MTKSEFEEKAISYGYTTAWVESAEKKMEKMNTKYGFDYSYDDIVIHELKKEKTADDKFTWTDGSVIIFRPPQR